MFIKILKILGKEMPPYLRNLSYIILVLDTIAIIIIYFFPELWAKFIKSF